MIGMIFGEGRFANAPCDQGRDQFWGAMPTLRGKVVGQGDKLIGKLIEFMNDRRRYSANVGRRRACAA
jgi:hypothetical protein